MVETSERPLKLSFTNVYTYQLIRFDEFQTIF